MTDKGAAAKHVYCYSDDDEVFYNDTCEPVTRQKAIEIATRGYPDGFYLGIKEDIFIENYIEADDILNEISERIYSEAGEVAEGWPDASRQEEQDLTTRIREVVKKWAADTDNTPLFFSVQNVEFIKNEND
jgi:hypothetical protein